MTMTMSKVRRLAEVAMVALGAMALCQGCIHKLGTSPDSLAVHKGGTEWDYGHFGDDWSGVDAAGKEWKCLSGKRQSPINVDKEGFAAAAGSFVAPKLFTSWSYDQLYSNGSNIEIINNGHTIQIEWLHTYTSNVTVAAPANPANTTTVTAVLGMTKTDEVKRVKATPLQFHFHGSSEHWVDGRQHPLELHIVHRVTDLPGCSAGCFSVLGILFVLQDGGDDADNPLLASIWDSMPMREGEIKFLPAGKSIQLNDMLPSVLQRSYVTYEGSLTTPPCSEGLLWHVLMKPQTISRKQLLKYQTATGFKECEHHNTTAAHHHHRHHHRHLRSIDRQLLAEAATNETHDPSAYTCEVVALGYNFRMAQAGNERVVKYAQGPVVDPSASSAKNSGFAIAGIRMAVRLGVTAAVGASTTINGIPVTVNCNDVDSSMAGALKSYLAEESFAEVDGSVFSCAPSATAGRRLLDNSATPSTLDLSFEYDAPLGFHDSYEGADGFRQLFNAALAALSAQSASSGGTQGLALRVPATSDYAFTFKVSTTGNAADAATALCDGHSAGSVATVNGKAYTCADVNKKKKPAMAAIIGGAVAGGVVLLAVVAVLAVVLMRRRRKLPAEGGASTTSVKPKQVAPEPQVAAVIRVAGDEGDKPAAAQKQRQQAQHQMEVDREESLVVPYSAP